MMEQASPTEVTIATGRGWRLAKVRCAGKVGDRHVEERHSHHVIAVVQKGMFSYHGTQGRTLLHAGAVLLGHQGSCYACGHDHGDGDQCLALQMDDEFFSDLSGEVTGKGSFAFPQSQAAITPAWLRHIAFLPEATSCGSNEENITAFAGAVMSDLSGAPAEKAISLDDELRIGRALRLMEHHRDTHLELAALARSAHMSKFHFLRVFKRVTGVSPYQHILRLRLADVARRLRIGHEPVTDIALACGFGDISTFNRTFKNVYGSSPTAFRKLNA